MRDAMTPDPTPETPREPAIRLDLAAAAIGPLAAASAGAWALVAASAFLELVGLVLIAQALWPSAAPDEPRGALRGGLALLLAGRALLALAVPALEQARRRRGDATETAQARTARIALGGALLAAVYALVLARFAPPEPAEWLTRFPTDPAIATAVTGAIDTGVDALTDAGRDVFAAITVGLRGMLNAVETVFVDTPWPATALVIVALAWRLSGWRVAVFAAAALAYMGLLGLWEESFETIALVAVSVGLCVAIGLPLGVAAAKLPRFRAVIEPVLDVMQTLPTFVYLIPAVALFSIGKPPGVIATVIFAAPSMIRLTDLGVRQVPGAMREAAEAFGATPWQVLWKVELPLAVPSILLGVNQTIMMSLSMVVVAALIGAGGLGEGVMKSLQFLKTGQGFVVGFAIVLVAMVLDRMVRGRRPGARGAPRPDGRG